MTRSTYTFVDLFGAAQPKHVECEVACFPVPRPFGRVDLVAERRPLLDSEWNDHRRCAVDFKEIVNSLGN